MVLNKLLISGQKSIYSKDNGHSHEIVLIFLFYFDHTEDHMIRSILLCAYFAAGLCSDVLLYVPGVGMRILRLWNQCFNGRTHACVQQAPLASVHLAGACLGQYGKVPCSWSVWFPGRSYCMFQGGTVGVAASSLNSCSKREKIWAVALLSFSHVGPLPAFYCSTGKVAILQVTVGNLIPRTQIHNTRRAWYLSHICM